MKVFQFPQAKTVKFEFTIFSDFFEIFQCKQAENQLEATKFDA